MKYRFSHILSTYLKPGIFLALGILLSCTAVQAQKGKVWFSGQGRGFFTLDEIDGEFRDADTVTAKNANGGYTLLDLGINFNPNDQVDVNAIIRARNEFGGFWGAGTTIELRQLYVRGLVGKVVHYGIGDLYFHQSRFTLHNTEEEGSILENDLLNVYKDVVHYENFYQENDWRMQGMQTNLVLDFDRFVKTAEVDGFLARNRGAVFGGLPDMLMGGGSLNLTQSDQFQAGVNFASLFEVPSTTNADVAYHNPVATVTASFTQPMDSMELNLFAEAGGSKASYKGDTMAPPTRRDFFVEAGAALDLPKQALNLKLVYRQVGANFRSAGAQTRRFNFDTQNTIYPLYTNDQVLRSTSINDLLTDELRYNQNLSQTLQTFDPKFNNSQPFGDATPNRAGIHFEANYTPESEKGTAFATAGYSRELRGQGTPELKNFVLVTAGGTLNLNKFLGWDRKLQLSAGIRQENTSRSGDSLAQVQLSSTLIDAGLTIETVKKLDLIGGVKWFSANGNEYLTNRGFYGEVNGFPVYLVDQQENVYAAGFKFSFKENVYFTVQGNWIGVNDKTDQIEDYNFSRLLVLFNMKF